MGIINTGDMAYLLGWEEEEKAVVKVVQTFSPVWGKCHIVEFTKDSVHLGHMFKAGERLGGDIWSEGSDKEYYSRNLLPIEGN